MRFVWACPETRLRTGLGISDDLGQVRGDCFQRNAVVAIISNQGRLRFSKHVISPTRDDE